MQVAVTLRESCVRQSSPSSIGSRPNTHSLRSSTTPPLLSGTWCVRRRAGPSIARASLLQVLVSTAHMLFSQQPLWFSYTVSSKATIQTFTFEFKFSPWIVPLNCTRRVLWFPSVLCILSVLFFLSPESPVRAQVTAPADTSRQVSWFDGVRCSSRDLSAHWQETSQSLPPQRPECPQKGRRRGRMRARHRERVAQTTTSRSSFLSKCSCCCTRRCSSSTWRPARFSFTRGSSAAGRTSAASGAASHSRSPRPNSVHSTRSLSTGHVLGLEQYLCRTIVFTRPNIQYFVICIKYSRYSKDFHYCLHSNIRLLPVIKHSGWRNFGSNLNITHLSRFWVEISSSRSSHAIESFIDVYSVCIWHKIKAIRILAATIVFFVRWAPFQIGILSFSDDSLDI